MRGHCFVDGVEKHVKCAYVGVNGKAQYIMKPPGVIKYGGSVEKILNSGQNVSAGSIGDYILIAGGSIYDRSSKSWTYYDSVSAYDKSFVQTSAPVLSSKRAPLYSGVTIGNHVIFGASFSSNYVDAYDSNLTKTAISKFNNCSRYTVKNGISLGNYAIFGGGGSSSSSVFAEIYDSSLTKISNSYKFSKRSFGMMAASIENYAIFAGGTTSSMIPPSESDIYSDAIAFNKNLTNVSIKSLSHPRWNSAATNINKKYAIFSGDGESNITSIDAYDSELTLTTINSAFYKYSLNSVGVSINNYALLGGSSSTASWKRVIVFDINLVKSIAPDLEDIGYYISATSDTAKKYAVFTGGSRYNGIMNVYTYNDGYIP